MKEINKSIRFIKKVGDGIYGFINNFNDDTLYVFDFEDVKKQYYRVLEIYSNNPASLDLRDFSKNYAFAFYQKMNLLDYQRDEEANKMTEEVYHYLNNLKQKGEL